MKYGHRQKRSDQAHAPVPTAVTSRADEFNWVHDRLHCGLTAANSRRRPPTTAPHHQIGVGAYARQSRSGTTKMSPRSAVHRAVHEPISATLATCAGGPRHQSGPIKTASGLPLDGSARLHRAGIVCGRVGYQGSKFREALVFLGSQFEYCASARDDGVGELQPPSGHLG